MSVFFQATVGVLLAVVLTLTIRRQGSEMAMLLSLAVCCIVAGLAIRYLEPIVTFMLRLQSIASVDADTLRILLKAVGIAFTAEIAVMICEDSGNGALGKALQMLASAVILYLALPILTALLELVENILGNV